MMKAGEQLAWAAGLIDGEGCFAVTRGRFNSKTNHQSVSAALKISQASLDGSPEVLVRMQELFGGRLYTHVAHTNPNAKPQYDWQISGFVAVQAVLAAIWAWLSGIKREQAVRVLREDNTFRPARNYSYEVRIPGHTKGIAISKKRTRRVTEARYGTLRAELLST